MTFILISGKTSVGKTHVCEKVRDLLDVRSYDDVEIVTVAEFFERYGGQFLSG